MWYSLPNINGAFPGSVSGVISTNVLNLASPYKAKGDNLTPPPNEEYDMCVCGALRA